MKRLTPHAPSLDAIESDLDLYLYLDLLDRPRSSLARRDSASRGGARGVR